MFRERAFFFRLLEEIRRYLKVGNRPAAMKLLRKKKMLERELEKKEGTIDHLTHVLTQIEQTDCSSLVINAYSSGVQAHKELLKKNGLTPDAVEDMLDEVHDVNRSIPVHRTTVHTSLVSGARYSERSGRSVESADRQ